MIGRYLPLVFIRPLSVNEVARSGHCVTIHENSCKGDILLVPRSVAKSDQWPSMHEFMNACDIDTPCTT